MGLSQTYLLKYRQYGHWVDRRYDTPVEKRLGERQFIFHDSVIERSHEANFCKAKQRRSDEQNMSKQCYSLHGCALYNRLTCLSLCLLPNQKCIDQSSHHCEKQDCSDVVYKVTIVQGIRRIQHDRWQQEDEEGSRWELPEMRRILYFVKMAWPGRGSLCYD